MSQNRAGEKDRHVLNQDYELTSVEHMQLEHLLEHLEHLDQQHITASQQIMAKLDALNARLDKVEETQHVHPLRIRGSAKEKGSTTVGD